LTAQRTWNYLVGVGKVATTLSHLCEDTKEHKKEIRRNLKIFVNHFVGNFLLNILKKWQLGT
jgi:hypothetical protein